MQDFNLDIDMEDAQEVQLISEFISESRNQQQFEEFDDQMDVDRFMLKTEVVPLQGNISYLTIDTNFMLSNLYVVEQLRRLSSNYHLVLIIPLEVVRELDGLKNADNSNERGDKSIGKLARTAITWMFQSLAEKNSNVKGQANKQKVQKFARKDDAILDCSLYFRSQFPNSLHILMSNDKNLCAKALANDILTISYQANMSPQLIAEKVYEENVLRFGKIDPSTASMRQIEVPVTNIPVNEKAVAEACETIYKEVSVLVMSIVARCMKEEYGDDLGLIRDYDPSASTSLDQQVQNIIRFWIPVFSDRMKTHPFEEDGKWKIPIHNFIPQDAKELKEFVEFWSECLMELYEGIMETAEVESLKVLIDRWSQLSTFL